MRSKKVKEYEMGESLSDPTTVDSQSPIYPSYDPLEEINGHSSSYELHTDTNGE